MKLTIKKLQALDILFKYFSYREDLDSTFNLVIKIDNQLWQGDFTLFRDNQFKDYYLDYDCDVESHSYYMNYFIFLYEDIKFSKYRKIYMKSKEDNCLNSLILKEFIKILDKSSLSDFEPCKTLYNAVNLNTNTKLPFLTLQDDEYEVVSLILKDECTHY